MDIANMMYDVSEYLVDEYHSIEDFDSFNYELIRSLSIESPVSSEEFLKFDRNEIIETVNKTVIDSYKRKVEAIAAQALPVIKEVYEKQSHVYENIVVPITDGTRVFQIISPNLFIN
ncbi:MAG: preprotein translocase subunit SecA, partial [Bacteroidetes bacterium]|nr:preprotein translocase subunit SecA [Bacteroidota bacterium]